MRSCGHTKLADDFGLSQPSQLPIGLNEDGDVIVESGFDQPIPANAQVTGLNTRDTVTEIRETLNSRDAALAAPLVTLWNRQAAIIQPVDIRTYGLSQDVLNDIRDSYTAYVEDSLSPVWFSVAAIGAANVSPGIEAVFGMSPGIFLPVSTPGIAARQWTQVRALNLVADITNMQGRAAQSIIQRGLSQGLGEQAIARQVRDVIGLTTREAQVIDNLRARLIVQDVPELRRIRILERRRKQLHKARSLRIARTEMTWAHNMGQLDAVKSYQAAGWIPPNVVVAKKWRKVLPVVECFCDSLDGQIIGIDGTFPGATPQVQTTLTPPAHPNCACAIDIVFLEAGPLFGGIQ